MEHDTGGDPVTGVKWSRRTTAKVAMALGDFGITVSPNTVARLLHRMGYASASTTSSSPPTPVPIATRWRASIAPRLETMSDGKPSHSLLLQPTPRSLLRHQATPER
ncbi:MAG: ISAzo13-like element transposase-related protein [Vicinamibacteria bacterium]